MARASIPVVVEHDLRKDILPYEHLILGQDTCHIPSLYPGYVGFVIVTPIHYVAQNRREDSPLTNQRTPSHV
jgi:hypothetical protein